MEKRVCRAPARFADQYHPDIEIDSSSDDDAGFERSYKIYRPPYVSQLLALYEKNFLPLRGPFVFPEAILKKMERICPEQPHPKLFCWATQAGVCTDDYQLVKLILLAEGRAEIREKVAGSKVPAGGDGKFKVVGGESRLEYVFYLNQQLEHVLSANSFEDTGLEISCLIRFEAISCLNHGLHQLHVRLRDVVSGKTQRPLQDFGASISAFVPLHVVVALLPQEVVDCFVQGGAGDGGVVHPRLVAPITDLQLLDGLFPPSPEDLATDDTQDPVFKHSTKQRWWCHYRTNPTTRYAIVDRICLIYDLRRGELYLTGYYRKHSKANCPDGVDALSVEWN
jgi:hypothetical protein